MTVSTSRRRPYMDHEVAAELDRRGVAAQLSGTALAVFHEIARRADFKTGRNAIVPAESLAERFGTDLRTVERAISKLKATGLVVVTEQGGGHKTGGDGRCNVYAVPDWPTTTPAALPGKDAAPTPAATPAAAPAGTPDHQDTNDQTALGNPLRPGRALGEEVHSNNGHQGKQDLFSVFPELAPEARRLANELRHEVAPGRHPGDVVLDDLADFAEYAVRKGVADAQLLLDVTKDKRPAAMLKNAHLIVAEAKRQLAAPRIAHPNHGARP